VITVGNVISRAADRCRQAAKCILQSQSSTESAQDQLRALLDALVHLEDAGSMLENLAGSAPDLGRVPADENGIVRADGVITVKSVERRKGPSTRGKRAGRAPKSGVHRNAGGTL
jgi:hypothetical protein